MGYRNKFMRTDKLIVDLKKVRDNYVFKIPTKLLDHKPLDLENWILKRVGKNRFELYKIK